MKFKQTTVQFSEIECWSKGFIGGRRITLYRLYGSCYSCNCFSRVVCSKLDYELNVAWLGLGNQAGNPSCLAVAAACIISTGTHFGDDHG